MNMIKIMVLMLAMLSFTGCEYVRPGEVGIKVYLLGGDKGVDSEELGVGRYWIGINEKLHVFPTFTQNVVWTQDRKEGSPNDESIKFQTVKGMTVGADVGVSYSIDPSKVSLIFQKYRKGVDEITDIYLRNMVRDAFVTQASTRKIEDVYGAGKSEMMKAVQKQVMDSCEDIGINIEKIYLIGELRLPETVTNALNAKITATQKAEQKENEIQETIAEANKAREEAKGVADAIKTVENAKSNAAAYRITSLAKAKSEAIELKGKQLKRYPQVLELTKLEEWDGVLSKYVGGSLTPIIDINR